MVRSQNGVSGSVSYNSQSRLRQEDDYAAPSCAGLDAGEIRSIGDAARAGDGDDSRVRSTTSDASDERLMALEYGAVDAAV